MKANHLVTAALAVSTAIGASFLEACNRQSGPPPKPVASTFDPVRNYGGQKAATRHTWTGWSPIETAGSLKVLLSDDWKGCEEGMSNLARAYPASAEAAKSYCANEKAAIAAEIPKLQ